MLVLTRTAGQAIQIDREGWAEPIWVEVLAVRAGQVRLGFTAPQDVVILREELLEEDG